MLANALLKSSLWLVSLSTQPCPLLPTCRHQYWDASGQASSWAGTQPHLPASKLRPQPPLNIALSTRGSRTQPHTPVHRHYTWDPLDPAARDPRTSSTHPWSGTSPVTTTTLQPAMEGHNHFTSRPIPVLTPGSGPTHQLANTSIVTSWTPHPAVSGPNPTYK